MTITNKNYKRSQKGRSMVEMLGVLAIVGVLSVGGVYGYGVAMKKHKANELLHQASMLATTISAKALTNDGVLPETITDFGNSGYDTDLTDNGTKFILTMKDVDSAVCNQLKKGGMVQKVECQAGTSEGKVNAEITYYKNLATDPAEGEKSPTGGSSNSFNPNGPTEDEEGAVCSGTRPGECSICLSTGESSAHWFDTNALCTAGQICWNGTCVTSIPDGNACLCENDDYCGGDESFPCYGDDLVCTTYYGFGEWDSTQEKCVGACANNGDCASDEYCRYTNLPEDETEHPFFGQCEKKEGARGNFVSGTTAEKDGFIRSAEALDWVNARNFCNSYGMNIVTANQMGFKNFSHCGGNDCPITAQELATMKARFGSEIDYWVAISNPGGEFYYSEKYGIVAMQYLNRYAQLPVLCR